MLTSLYGGQPEEDGGNAEEDRRGRQFSGAEEVAKDPEAQPSAPAEMFVPPPRNAAKTVPTARSTPMAQEIQPPSSVACPSGT